MDIFLSWSQTRSETVARALHDWIPLVLQPARPWLSREIEKGTRWDDVISRKLEACDFGIVCLTPENLHSDWLLFEAGALSKKISDSHVCTYLLDLKPSDVTGPLAKFQHTSATKEDTRVLVETLNAALADQRLDADRFRHTFEQWWPDLERRLAIAETQTIVASPTGRRTEDKIDEILLTIRGLDARLQRSASPTEDQPTGSLRNERLQKLIGDANWEDLTPRLLAYTVTRVGASPTRAADYVSRAILAVITGDYEITANSASSLFAFLCTVIDDLTRQTSRGPSK